MHDVTRALKQRIASLRASGSVKTPVEEVLRPGAASRRKRTPVIASFVSCHDDARAIRCRLHATRIVVIESAARYARLGAGGMSEDERDQLDDAVAETIESCADGVESLKKRATRQ